MYRHYFYRYQTYSKYLLREVKVSKTFIAKKGVTVVNLVSEN